MSEDEDYFDFRDESTYQWQQLEQKARQLQKYEEYLKQKHFELQKRERQLEQKHRPQYQQEQHTPFHIVLIDIKAAAEEQVLRCEEKPLVGDDLKYVALSYRWGELNEYMVDTGLDYLATITSFHIDHFYRLCQAIAKEVDLRYMDYVWVDAICVDQSNYERRKATVHQMSNIYDQANYILAVPDLNWGHLWCSHFSVQENMFYVRTHGELIFQLIHGNVEELCRIDYEKLGGDDLTLSERNKRLEEAINFLAELLADWASRVWVISEYSIARKYNNLKFWFVLLGYQYSLQHRRPESASFLSENYSFFKFDFNNITFSMPPFDTNFASTDSPTMGEVGSHFKRLYGSFHSMLKHRLRTQTFLEMILKSKASKNEDRFHAVLQHNAQYKHIIQSKDDVDSWNITNLLSIKLKLFEFMRVSDKVVLLFLAGSHQSLKYAPDLLPTFATSGIDWPKRLYSYFQAKPEEWNFAINNKSTIIMMPINDHSIGDYKLNVKPIQYFSVFGKASEIEVNRFRKLPMSLFRLSIFLSAPLSLVTIL